MYRRPSKKTETIRRLFLYFGMTILVLTGVTTIILIILGYQFDGQNGRVEQGALLQYETQPSGATVTVDGRTLTGKTPTKGSVLAGTHTIAMTKDGYETWTKTVDIKAGTLTWLDYARLVPVKRPIEAVETYAKLSGSLASPDGQVMLVHTEAASPTFNLVDLSDDKVSQTSLTLPATLYSQATTLGVAHAFRMDQWDKAGRFVLLQHTYGDKNEWIQMDTKDIAASKNITALLGVPISSARLSGTSGNSLFVLSAGDIRKLDLGAATISRALVSNVTSFELYDSNIITYVGKDTADNTMRVVGVYRDGDSIPHVLRKTTNSNSSLHIATSRYFNDDYVAISEGSRVDVLYGSYPSSSTDTKSLKPYSSFDLSVDVEYLQFSPRGYYIVAQHGNIFAGFDVERKTTKTSSVPATTTPMRPLQWLDNANLWSDTDGQLTMREFDGTNAVVVNNLEHGYDVTLSKNERYLYSIGKSTGGYQLQRVRMILP
jgi:hypothetical protein